MWVFCCCDLVATQLDCKVIWFLHKNCILTCNNHMFCSISLFRYFFVEFSSKRLVIYSKSILSAHLVLVKRSLVRKRYYLQRFRHPFFKEAPLGRPKVWYCRQSHFFEKHFFFFQKWVWRQYHTLGLWTPLRETIFWANPLFYLRNFMVFLKHINII